MGQFKQKYPQVHSMGDAGELLMGPFGRELFFFGQLLFIIFLMASHILTFSVLFNTITDHGTCTIVFGVVGLIFSCICALPRTSSKLFIMSTVSACSILIATITTMISIGVQAPDYVENDITTSPDFVDAFLAVTNIVFAFIAHVAFFGFMSEMEDTKQFPKSLAMLQFVEHYPVHRDIDGHLLLCRPRRGITRSVIRWTRDEESRLRSGHSYSMSLL